MKAVAPGPACTTAETKKYLTEPAAFRAAFFIPYWTSKMTWVENGAIGTRLGSSKSPLAVYVRNDGVGTPYIPAAGGAVDTWHTVDLIANGTGIPADCTSVFLSGLLIITHPGTPGLTADIFATFRAPGDTSAAGNYQIQTLVTTAAQGVRSTAALWVPVVDGKFEFYWHATAGCPSLINLSLQAYARGSAAAVGPEGPQGPIGPEGPAGPQGPQGIPGTPGLNDSDYFGPPDSGGVGYRVFRVPNL